jgi:hypothetical protein
MSTIARTTHKTTVNRFSAEISMERLQALREIGEPCPSFEGEHVIFYAISGAGRNI